MPLEISEPFVKDVYDLVAQGQLVESEALLREVIQDEPVSDLHSVLDLDEQTFLPKLGDWLESGIVDEVKLDSSVAISLSMGEFEVNYDDWSVSAIIHKSYDKPDDNYVWISESEGYFLCDCYEVSGLSKIKNALEKDYQWCLSADEGTAPYSSRVYTAACYFLFILFLKAIRQLHDESLHRNSRISAIQLFGSYGDCLYHSQAKNK